MEIKFSAKKGKKFIIKLIILSVVVYVISIFISQQIKIKNKQDELRLVNEQILNEKTKNQKIRDKLNESVNGSDFVKGKSDKRVFENVAE